MAKLSTRIVEIFTDDFGTVISNIHDWKQCAGRNCVIHNPSSHVMSEFLLCWRQAGPLDFKPSHFERICPHGVGHPDPDDLAYFKSIGMDFMGVHGCDGCCLEEPGSATL